MKIPLFTRKELAEADGLPEWFREEIRRFRSAVTHPDFPCYFGITAEKKGEVLYAYTEQGDYGALPAILQSYLNMDEAAEAILSLALFVRQERVFSDLEPYRKQFWGILQYLHEHDPGPWPDGVPTDPDRPMWNFCFGGRHLFVFAGTPAYRQRRSRNLGNSLVLMFQPMELFTDFGPGNPVGIQARTIIRDRIRKFDGIEPHPDLGDLEGNLVHPWKMYVLPDNMEPETGSCPFRSRLPRP